MMDLPFTKMHGAGNDFVIVDNRERLLSNDEIVALAPRICRRRFGVGADGIMALQPPETPDLDYTMFYRNADGSDAGMCGNGARCLALFAARAGLGEQLRFSVHDTVYQARVDMRSRRATVFFPMEVEIREVSLPEEPAIYQLHAGTEHIVLEVPERAFQNNELLISRGRKLRHHEMFNPPGTNVNFICGQQTDEIKIKTYERGVENLTLACGTGAIAAALTWHHISRPKPASSIRVQARGGTLQSDFSYDAAGGLYHDIRLAGAAEFVFRGSYER